MTKEQLKARQPQQYNEIFALGQREGIEAAKAEFKQSVLNQHRPPAANQSSAVNSDAIAMANKSLLENTNRVLTAMRLPILTSIDTGAVNGAVAVKAAGGVVFTASRNKTELNNAREISGDTSKNLVAVVAAMKNYH